MLFRLGEHIVPPLGRTRIYVCGITPYHTTHVGHAATFVWVDTLARVLEHVGVSVELCRNVTDVDDDLLAEARRRQLGWRELATQQASGFEEDMRKLHVRRPDLEPQSRDYVTDVVFMTRALLDRDAAYEREGWVYFRGADVPGRLGLGRDEALALAAEGGGRTDDPRPDDPLDVVLWQPSAAGEPAWASPWGDGRPGWHVECSAMVTSVLGLAVDVHAGGADLAFPHHAYEAAIAEAATGVAPFARAWLHVGTVHLGGRKMAKSTGNLVFVDDLLRRWPAAAVRYLILDRDWAEPWEFDESDLAGAAERVERLWSRGAEAGDDEVAAREVARSLVEGLDTRRALAVADEGGGGAARLATRLLALS